MDEYAVVCEVNKNRRRTVRFLSLLDGDESGWYAFAQPPPAFGALFHLP